MRLFLAALTLVVTTTPALAQWLDRKTPNIPRTADGKPNLTAAAPRGPDGKPDLNGVWNGPAPQTRPEVADLQPWVMDLARKHQQDYYKARPAYLCRPSGPEAEKFGGWKRILQTPSAIAILSDDLTYRLIHMDGRTLEANPAPSAGEGERGQHGHAPRRGISPSAEGGALGAAAGGAPALARGRAPQECAGH